MRSGLSLVGPPPSLPVMPVPMQPPPQPMLGMPSSLPPPPPPVPGYLRKRKPTDVNDLSLGGMNQASGARHEELEARKKLTNIRVVQPNLVYVTNISLDFLNKGSASLEITPGEFLSRQEYFGQYGEIFKLVVNLNAIYNANSSHGPSVSCYVTYRRNDDATACITAVNGAWLGGKLLRASNGTTKYCTYFLRGLTCSNAECLYLHELGHDKDSFTKESMAADKNLFSESVHPKISFTERGENVLPPVYSNLKLDMSTLVIYERAASLFPPKYSDVMSRPSNYIIVTSSSKIVTVFLSPASGSGPILSSVICPTPQGSSTTTTNSSSNTTPMGAASPTTFLQGQQGQQQGMLGGSVSPNAGMGMGTAAILQTSVIPQDMASPLIHSASPQHQQYYPGHGPQPHSPTSPPASPQKAFNSHAGMMVVMGGPSGAQVVSSPFASYEGRPAGLLSENTDEFPPLNSAVDGNALSSSLASSKMSKKDRRKGEFGFPGEGYNENEGFGDEMMPGPEMPGYHEGYYYEDEQDGNNNNEDYGEDEEEQDEREREEERKRRERRLRHRRLVDCDIGKLSDEELALSSVIRSLGDEFEDDMALINRIRGGDDEFGTNPLLHAMPPLDDMPFINSDRDSAALFPEESGTTFGISALSTSQQQQQQQQQEQTALTMSSDEDSVFSYGPADFGYELFTGFYQNSFAGEDTAYQSGADPKMLDDGTSAEYMRGSAEAALLSSADNSDVVSGANSVEEGGEYENSGEGNGEDEEYDEDDDDNDEDDEDEDDEDDDDDEQEKARPRVLPRCSCSGGLILSLARNKRKTSNDNETDKSEGENGDEENNNKGGDDDDDDDDVPPELVDPSNSEEEDDDDEGDEDGKVNEKEDGDGDNNDDSENSRNEDGEKEKSSGGVLPSILDGNGTVSATDHVAIHIPNSSILICPLYSRSSTKKNN